MWRRLRTLVAGARLDRQLDAEVRFHIDMEAEKYVRQGMTPEAARRMAVRRFGPMERLKDETRDARGVAWLEQSMQDVRYGARMLARNPGFTLFAVLTLGLGIGANAAIYSVINGVLLKPLPYENGDRLVLIQQTTPLTSQPNFGVSIKELYDYRVQLGSFENLVEFHQMSFDLLRRGEPDRVAAGVVSPNFFNTLGIKPMLGRAFVDADDDHGADAVLVLGHAYWQSKFGGDRNIVGQVFEMNDRPHTVVGVLPPVPLYPNEVDVYMPTSACPFRARAETQIENNRRAFSALNVFGVLKPGASQAAAATEVATVAERFKRDFPAVYRPATGFQARTADVRAQLTAGARQMLLILLGTTGLVLLIACANVASLMLARMLRRDRELAMRTALGAGRWRLVRQLLTESTLLSVAGGIFGLVFAASTLDLLKTFAGRFTARTGEIDMDPGVLAFTMLVSVLTGLIFGTLPALSSRGDVVETLKSGGKGTSGGGGNRRRLQRGLVVAQVAVSVVLLVGAGLLLLSFFRLQRVDAGFRADRVMAAEIFGNFTKYPNAQALRRLYTSVLDRLQTAPGVMSAAVTNAIPLAGLQPGQVRFQIRGRTYDTPEQRPTADVRIASPQFFTTMGIPLRHGRVFTELDDERAAPVALVNEAMVRQWDGRHPLDTEISFDNGDSWLKVVGVVGDVKAFGLDRDAVAQIYRPLRQTGGLAGRLLVRMNGDPSSATALIREAVHAVDPDLPIENVRTLDEIKDRYLATPRLTATLLAIFAALALLVTIAGITGVIATSVSERTQEFGIRMALGATRQAVLGMILGQGIALVAAGLVIGVTASLALSRVLQTYLYRTAPTDPLTFILVAVAFVVAGTLACLGPAWRATTVDPMRALRAE